MWLILLAFVAGFSFVAGMAFAGFLAFLGFRVLARQFSREMG